MYVCEWEGEGEGGGEINLVAQWPLIEFVWAIAMHVHTVLCEAIGEDIEAAEAYAVFGSSVRRLLG